MTRALRPLAALAVMAALTSGCEAPADAPAERAPTETAAEPAPTTADAPSRTGGRPTVEAMQGAWRSRDDAKSEMRIDGDRVVDRYDGEDLREGTIRAVRSCDDLAPVADGDHVVIEADGETSCYEIDAVTATSLAYFYLPRGNRLHFERIAD